MGGVCWVAIGTGEFHLDTVALTRSQMGQPEGLRGGEVFGLLLISYVLLPVGRVYDGLAEGFEILVTDGVSTWKTAVDTHTSITAIHTHQRRTEFRLRIGLEGLGHTF